MDKPDENQTDETPNENPEQPETEPEQPKPEDEQPEAVEAKEEGEAAEEAPEGEGAEPPKAEEANRRAGGWKRKIERQERELEYLRAQVAQRPAQQQPATPEKPKDPAAQVEDYVASLVEQRLQAERVKEQQARSQAEFQRRTQEMRASHPDFDDVLEDVRHVPVPQHVQHVLLTSEHGPALMYRLAKNPVELARISALPPFEAAREIGRLEAQASSTPAPKTPTKSATRPPAPPTSVAGSSSSARSLDDLPLSEYKRAYRSGRR